MKKNIIHCDLNNFFASVEAIDEPEYKNRPFAVCGSIENRHGIILAKNELAKKAGITTGMTLSKAKNLCKDLITAESNYNKYLIYSKKVRDIYEQYTDKIESFGIDEAWLDLSDLKENPFNIALKIKEQVKNELNLTISVGISFTKPFAKLASELKKPDGITVIDKSNYKRILYKRDVGDLLFVGKKIKKKLNDINIFTIGELANASPLLLATTLGKWGSVLYSFANATDNEKVVPNTIEEPAKSIGNSTTSYRDLENNDDIDILFRTLAESVVERTLSSGFSNPSTLSITIKDNKLNSFTKNTSLTGCVLTVKNIHIQAFSLFKDSYSWENPVRALGITLSGFNKNEKDTVLDKNSKKQRDLENAILKLSKKFGKHTVKSGISLIDKKLVDQNFHDKGISD
ncbi:MAG: DNA polymerase IV [Clostridia bacterium]|nr:DNA polymerase IV [Clostridia bacterium]